MQTMIRKLTCLLFFLVIASFNMNAQIRVVEYEAAVLSSPDSSDVYNYLYMINDGADQVSLLWERTVEGLPDGSFTWICDNNLCYLPTANKAAETKPNVLANGDTLLLQLHLNPKGNLGTTNVKVEVFDKFSPETKLASVEVDFMISSTTSTSNLTQDEIKVFPNPTVDFFRINYNEVSKVTIYNIVGSKMLEFDAFPDKSYDVTDLKQGIYLVRMTDDQNKVIKTVRLSKR